jgi:putative DNA primase/helicase
VAVLQDELDRGEYFLNCANGTVDLRDGSLAPADREALITKLIDIDYGENARAERFERFLQEVFEGKAELIDYLQRAIGYSFTADLSEQCLHLLHGAGANGKSTLIDVLLKVSGDYGQTAGAQIVLTKFGTAIPTDIAALCGSRFISINETGESRAMDEAVVKTLTSVEPISARFLHRNFFNFVPTHHLWLSSNHKPRISGTDHGIWRRIRLIPFTQVFPLNLTLHEELESELPGILAWVVAGASKWYREGLEIPLEISRATKAYRSEQDVLDDFLKECCDEGPDCEILSKDLYELYKNWAKESGEDVWSKKLLGRRLADRGFVSGRTSTTNMAKWGGLSQKYYAKD